ncbi:NAD(P)H-binding protein [Tomitella fengzijianii]|uniref:NAD-dependent epimerase/dehydratase family protein n=1 Tax=Tomitella fengzijianii TaxID=2597660 RepID=A0A516WYV6_9ACTN|nr:NAD(P)H-binding protein [Tomitella fengzijianii]QDQ96028.1 NAD-dependent epimerase/dehydratase family protein [Tomitella fengzijianii]
MATTLVIGATGYLGRHIVAELQARGHHVRAITRDRYRAERPGPWDAPPLGGSTTELIVGEITDPVITDGIAEGTDHVISALGVTRQNADPWTVDNLANLAVLRSAIKHGATSFSYVNVIDGEQCPARITRAKTAFAQTLDLAPIVSQRINPTGYFSDMMEMFSAARRGVVPILRPAGRINPIHGADLASYIVDRAEAGENGTWDVGGPDVFTWAGLAEAAFTALGKKTRTVRIPPQIVPPVLRLAGVFNSRLADSAAFATWSMLHDCVGTPAGSRHLAEFYSQQAGR